MLGSLSGRSYRVKVDELISSLKKNRNEHASIVEEAQAAFREATIKRLDEMLSSARSGRGVDVHVGLHVPTSHIEVFDNAIGLLEMTKRAGVEETEITADEYARFMENRWEWLREFSTSNRAYTARV